MRESLTIGLTRYWRQLTRADDRGIEPNPRVLRRRVYIGDDGVRMQLQSERPARSIWS